MEVARMNIYQLFQTRFVISARRLTIYHVVFCYVCEKYRQCDGSKWGGVTQMTSQPSLLRNNMAGDMKVC